MAGFISLKSLNEKKAQSQVVYTGNWKNKTKQNKYIFMWRRLHADNAVI